MSYDASIDKDLENRLSKASSSFGRLSNRVWRNHSLRLITKIKVYRAVVIPTLMYGAETWTLYRRHVRLLECFHQRCLRSILDIKWHDYVSNEDVLEEAPSNSYAGQGTSREWKTLACQKLSFSVNSKPGSETTVLQKSGTRTNSRNSFL